MFKKSKWIPLMAYEYSGNSYMILCSKNLKTGMLYFKCKKMNGFSSLSYRYPKIDTDTQFEILMKL
jgi:hypothetical protein